MKPVWKIVIVALITAVIVGGLTYYYLNTKAKQEKNDLQTQIDDLNKKIADQEAAAAAASDTATAAATKTISTTPTAATTTLASTTPPASSSDWKAYTNSTYGFSMTFPDDAWKNYVITPVTPSDNSGTKYLYICVPTTDSSWKDDCAAGYFAPASIGVYTKAEWDAIKDSGTPESYGKIAENATYVFTFTQGQAIPTDLTNTTFNSKAVSDSFVAN